MLCYVNINILSTPHAKTMQWMTAIHLPHYIASVCLWRGRQFMCQYDPTWFQT